MALDIVPPQDGPLPEDEGGLRAPPHLHGLGKAWWWFHFLILVKLARLRFIAVLLVIGLVITQWDTLTAYYEKWTRPNATASTTDGQYEWFCGMHPSIVRDNPHEKCPICYMPLSKRKKSDHTEAALPPGVVNRVQLTPYRIVLAGVQTSLVEPVALSREIVTVGSIEFDERGERTVAARVRGRIDKLLVNETGSLVKAGDPLASLYSPDLLVTLQTLNDARQSGNQQLLQSARTKLELLGISGEEIDAAVGAGDPPTRLTIRSPIAGHVIKKYVREGQYVQEGMPLYEVADLSSVWIQAQVYEDDMSLLPLAMSQSPNVPERKPLEVTATTLAYPNEVFRGKLTFIYPHVDQETHTVTVRFTLNNPDHKLRPGSTATVTIRVPLTDVPVLAKAAQRAPQRLAMLQSNRVLAVPESAVIDTGREQIVYREHSTGVFEGVLVELGPRLSGPGPDKVMFFPVLKGLDEGDHVVTAGSLLVDAETRLNPAAGSIYFGGTGSNRSGETTVRPSTPSDADTAVNSELAHLSAADRRLALAQRFCPIKKSSRLGSMGPPEKIMIDSKPVFLCCPRCKETAFKDPQGTLAKAAALVQQNAETK